MLFNFFSQISKISNLPSKNDDGKKIISLASHKNKRYPSLPPSSLYPNSTEKFSAWTHHGNGDVSRIIRHCDARVSERASARKRGGGERKRLEMYLGICRPTEVTQDDGFGDGFWVRGGRQAGGYWNRVVALTVRPTYDSSSSLLSPFLSPPQWRNRDREPPCHVGLGQFREELPNCLQLLHKRTMSKERRMARDS